MTKSLHPQLSSGDDDIPSIDTDRAAGALEGPAMSTYSGSVMSGLSDSDRFHDKRETNVRVALLHLVRAQRYGLAVRDGLSGSIPRRRDG